MVYPPDADSLYGVVVGDIKAGGQLAKHFALCAHFEAIVEAWESHPGEVFEDPHHGRGLSGPRQAVEHHLDLALLAYVWERA